jgi:hypothetical protein
MCRSSCRPQLGDQAIRAIIAWADAKIAAALAETGWMRRGAHPSIFG